MTSVSVVIATADRPGPLARCLAAVAALEHPRDALEVIVVDDGGSIHPQPVDGLRVRLLRRERGGPGAARNDGAQAAEGELLAFTDDDCLPEPGWLRALCAVSAESPSGTMIGGRTVNALAANRFAETSQHIQDLVYAHYNRDAERARFFATNNLAVPRDAFLALGGFDVAAFPFASEDRDLCDRWRASGRDLRSASDAVVHHAHDLDLRGFVRQHVAYGRGAARYHRARARRGTGRLRDDAAFHLDRSLWLRTARLRPARRAAEITALLALWQAANATGYLLEKVPHPAATE
ncbi:MAG: glycosyltransferase [Solirubrobacteraceae bacterium]